MSDQADRPEKPWEHSFSARIDLACDRFEAAWKAGQRPEIDDHLAMCAELDGASFPRELLVELVKIDMHYRWQEAADALAGHDVRSAESQAQASKEPSLCRLPPQPTLEDYVARYPALGSIHDVPNDLVSAAHSVRARRADQENTPDSWAGERWPPAGEFPGTQRFSIQRRIGAGGMGFVYRAYDRDRDEIVAIKTLRHVEPSAIYRLKREFRSLADLLHPNLVSLGELFYQGGQWFFTMKFVEGNDFLTYFRTGSGQQGAQIHEQQDKHASTGGMSAQTTGSWWTPDSGPENLPVTPRGSTAAQGSTDLSRARLLRLRTSLRQLVEGIMAIHAAGKLHRDIKPSNVLVDRAERVVVLDFGLATELEKSASMHTTGDHVVGTVAYMSPEQAAAKELSPASDWYSVGVMMYEAMTGRCPFQGPTLQLLVDKQQRDPPAPGDVAADVPEDLDSLCMALLERDPADRPTGTEVLHRLGAEEDISAGPATPPAASPQKSPFVGRLLEMAALYDALSTVKRGRPALVYVHGKSGVGKTALVQRYLAEVRTRDDTVILAGRCYEYESVPYKAFDSLVDALSHYLVGLFRLEADALMPLDVVALSHAFPVLQRVEAVAQAPVRGSTVPDQQERRDRAFGALRELFTRLGHRKTLVLFIDDLQWGDLDSAALLNDLIRPPDPPIFLLILCYRSEDEATSPVLPSMLQSERDASDKIDIRRVKLDPLDRTEARQLAQALLGARAEGLCEAIARESGGNPYFVGTLASHQKQGSLVAEASDSAESVSLDKVLWRSIAQLPVATRRLLEVVAVAGHPVRQQDALTAIGLAEEGHETIKMLRAARMIRTTGTGTEAEIEAYHDRIREILVARLPADALQRYHGRLAEVLEASGAADPATLASHYQSAGQTRRAGACCAASADEAARSLAFDRAASLYQRALELLPSHEAENRDLRRGLADALANAGRGAEAAMEYLAAAGRAGAGGALDLRSRAAMHFLTSGHVSDGLAALEIVLKTVGMRLPKSRLRAIWSLLLHRAMLRLRGLHFRQRETSQIAPDRLMKIDICWSATVGLTMVNPLRAADFQTRCLLLALRCGEPFLVARSVVLEAANLAAAGGSTRRRVKRLLDKAEKLAQTIDKPYLAGFLSLAIGASAQLQGRWHQAIECCQQAEKTFRDHCTGVTWELDTAKGFCLESMSFAGEVAKLTQRMPLVIEEARKRGDLYALAHNSTLVLPALAADDADRAEQEIHRWHQEESEVQRFGDLCAMVEIDLYRDRVTAAWDRVNRRWSALARTVLPRVQFLRALAFYARGRSALAAADTATNPARLLAVAQRDGRRLARERQPWIEPLGELICAGVAVLRRDVPKAVSLFRQAVTHFDTVDMPLHAMSARRRLGELLGGEEGTALIAQADAWMKSQGIRNPVRMTAVYAPGVAARPPGARARK